MKNKDYSQVVTEKFIESWQDLTKVSKPIVAAVNGYAVPQIETSINKCSSAGVVNWR